MTEACRSCEGIKVPSFDGYYPQRPQASACHQPLSPVVADNLPQTNILIDNDFHPRLTDYGLTMIVSDPNTAHAGTTTTPSGGTLYCMAPELLNPSSFGLEYSTPTKKSDIYALGMATYQVRTSCSVSDVAWKLKVTLRSSQGNNPSLGRTTE